MTPKIPMTRNPIRKQNLALVMLMAAIGVFVSTALYSLNLLTQTSIVENRVTESTFHFEVSPVYLLYPGQEVSLRWDVEGVKDLYLNGQGRVGHDMVRVPVTHCSDTPLVHVFSGETAGGDAYQYEIGWTYLFSTPLIWVGLWGGAALLLLAGLLRPLPVLTRTARETLALMGVPTAAYEAGFYVPVALMGTVATITFLQTPDSCSFAQGISFGRTNGLYPTVMVASVLLLVAGLIRPAWSRFLPVMRGYALALLLPAAITVLRLAGEGPDRLFRVDTLVILISAVMVLLLTRKTTIPRIRIAMFLLLIAAVVLTHLTAMIAQQRVTLRTNDRFSDLYPSVPVLAYQVAHEYYMNRALWVNDPLAFNASATTLLQRWSDMTYPPENRVEIPFTPDEIMALRERVTQTVPYPDFTLMMVPPLDGMAGPVLVTASAPDAVLMIPFEHLPERIQALWPVNSSF